MIGPRGLSRALSKLKIVARNYAPDDPVDKLKCSNLELERVRADTVPLLLTFWPHLDRMSPSLTGFRCKA